MKTWQAILLTIGILFLMLIVNNSQFAGLIVIASGIIIAIDADKTAMKKYNYKFWPKRGVVWLICVWLFWIVCFPAYLIIRGKIKAGQIPPIGGSEKEKGLFCPNCGTENTGDAKFCSKCGKGLSNIPQ